MIILKIIHCWSAGAPVYRQIITADICYGGSGDSGGKDTGLRNNEIGLVASKRMTDKAG